MKRLVKESLPEFLNESTNPDLVTDILMIISSILGFASLGISLPTFIHNQRVKSIAKRLAKEPEVVRALIHSDLYNREEIIKKYLTSKELKYLEEISIYKLKPYLPDKIEYDINGNKKSLYTFKKESVNEDWWDSIRPEEPKSGSFKDSKFDEEDRIKRLNIEREKKYGPTFPPESLVFAINNEENEIVAIIIPDPKRFAYVGPVNVDDEKFHKKFTKEEGEIAYNTNLSKQEAKEFLTSIGMGELDDAIKINFMKT